MTGCITLHFRIGSIPIVGESNRGGLKIIHDVIMHMLASGDAGSTLKCISFFFVWALLQGAYVLNSGFDAVIAYDAWLLFSELQLCVS